MISRYLLAAALFVSAAQAETKPNVLLILVDDLKPAIGAYGDKHAVTPHLDKLAARGVRFEHAYCNIAVCAPSRFNLMTGARSTSLGIYGFGSDLRDSFPDAVTLPQHFMRAGYSAESLGKVFHVGHGTHDDSASWSSPPFKDLVIEYVDPESKKGGKTREEALFSNEKGAGLPRGPAWEMPDVEDEAYADGRVATETIRRLKSYANTPKKPFFMAVGMARPHLPFSAPKKYWDLYDPMKLPMPEIEQAPEGAPAEAQKRAGEIAQYTPCPQEQDGVFPNDLKRKLIHGYYASTSYADAQIGRVLDALDETGLAENTIVVLWGDHGFHLGELGMWTKHVNYELANRIPLIFAGPGIGNHGAATGQPAETVDIYPTLAELAGLPKPTGPQPIDGLSLVPVLKDPAARIRDHAYHCFRRDRLGRAIRTETHRLVVWQNPDEADSAAVIELYDYADGPVEKKNIASDNPEIVSKLRAILDRHPKPVTNKPRPQPNRANP
ncbi:MAG: sulfatase [Akkermansiaceae bacterium]|nr:sulfatase [Akkermansiaceae bacterium]